MAWNIFEMATRMVVDGRGGGEGGLEAVPPAGGLGAKPPKAGVIAHSV